MRFKANYFVVSALLSPFALAVGCAKQQGDAGPAPVPVQARSVAAEDIRSSLHYSGEIRPETEIKLSFKQGGYIASLHQVRGADGRMRDVQVGDMLPAGTVMARLRSNGLAASLKSADEEQKASQGTLDAAQSEVEQAKSTALKADLDFKRAQTLYTAKAMTRPDYESAVNQHELALARVEEAKRTADARKAQVGAAMAQMESAKINLAETNLIAPVQCVVLSKSVVPGTLVGTGTEAFTVADVRTVKVEFGVPDTMLGSFHMGATVPVTIEAIRGKSFVGHITEIAASASRDTRVFSIQVSIPNPRREFMVGMIADVAIDAVGEPRKVPFVPVTSLITAQSGTDNYSVFVIVDEGGKQIARLKSVRIGEIVGQSVAVNEGLTPGERIIVTRTNQLADGSPVRITP